MTILPFGLSRPGPSMILFLQLCVHTFYIGCLYRLQYMACRNFNLHFDKTRSKKVFNAKLNIFIILSFIL